LGFRRTENKCQADCFRYNPVRGTAAQNALALTVKSLTVPKLAQPVNFEISFDSKPYLSIMYNIVVCFRVFAVWYACTVLLQKLRHIDLSSSVVDCFNSNVGVDWFASYQELCPMSFIICVAYFVLPVSNWMR